MADKKEHIEAVSSTFPQERIVNAKPELVYRKVRKDNIEYRRGLGYEFPTGDEKLQGLGTGADGRTHGDTVLMCCPREIVEARDAERKGLNDSRLKSMAKPEPRGPGRVGGQVVFKGSRRS
ncbi:MAG: hypothetical protein QMD05_08865 [Candidatus Brocadiaceae bacterium]|nr:hypothetical protein [Candidatus Brocadiaceae bacterium]